MYPHHSRKRRLWVLSIVDLDDRGRLTLPSEIRRAIKITKKVLIVNAGDHIKIIPLPEDPFKELKGALSIKTPFNKLRNEAMKQAQREAASNNPS
jgi:bifunctional DNA-binding transcriptional regulator/antitoxin component of YhaV-PrlF toxin-antitoxin module